MKHYRAVAGWGEVSACFWLLSRPNQFNHDLTAIISVIQILGMSYINIGLLAEDAARQTLQGFNRRYAAVGHSHLGDSFLYVTIRSTRDNGISFHQDAALPCTE
jgi:hypothetical protein